MSKEKKKILLICYSFPPFPGIGGRRWAKFTKNLIKEDYELFVIGAEHRMGKPSNWINDVSGSDKIHYHPIRTKFFDFFHNHNFNLVKKVKYKFSKFYLQKKYQGNFYDKVLSSQDLFFNKAKDLIKKNEIKNLIITIAPNRLVDVGIRLKKEFPELNFIFDIRDPWNICLDEWDHKYLSTEQKAFELQSELNAVKSADKVFSVYQVVADFYTQHFPNRKDDFIYLPNGYDTDDIATDVVQKEVIGKQYFVYTGILYDISIHLFEEFLVQIKKLNESSGDLLKEIEFHFYIPERAQFEKTVQKYELGSQVKFFDQVPLREIQQIIANSLACMLFLPPQFEFSLSTKFYEYLSYKKKILLFSNPGEVAKTIEEHKLGYVMLPNEMEIPFKKAVSDLTSAKELPAHTFPLGDYSVENLTKRIIPFLK